MRGPGYSLSARFPAVERNAMNDKQKRNAAQVRKNVRAGKVLSETETVKKAFKKARYEAADRQIMAAMRAKQ